MKTRLAFSALPSGFFVLAAATALAFANPTLLAQAARGFPYVVLLANALLAWRLHNPRLFSANLLITAALVGLQPALFGHDALISVLASTCLPVGLALLSFARDGGFTTRRLRNHLLLCVAPLAVAAFFSAGSPDATGRMLTQEFFDPVYTDWSALPQSALLTTALALVAAAIKFALAPRAVDAALFWSVLTTSSALAAPVGSTARGIWLLATGLVLLVAIIETAYALAFHDELTGLPGRRALNYALSSLHPPYAIAIIDIDHFKSFNDNHGHDVGDQVLRMVAARLRAVTGGGTAYRSGGEEFAIVFPGMNKAEAAEHVEALRATVGSARFSLRRLPRPRGKKAKDARGRGRRSAGELQVTISVGVAHASARTLSVEAVLAAADKAMYRAKSEGRNRVVA